jgi:CMP-N-acetylneuraminic acid synthetase
MDKLIGIIPARLGSKGVPRKNFRPFLEGKSLVRHTSDEATSAGLIHALSTDCEHGQAHVVHGRAWPRSPELATDDATVADVLRSHLDQIKATEATAVMVLYPTYALREAADIAWIADEWRKEPERGLVGVVPSREEAHLLVKHTWEYGASVRVRTSVALRPVVSDAWAKPNRQDYDYEPTYRLCLFACVVPVAQIPELPGQPIAPGSRALEIPEFKALDIDNWQDWHTAQELLRYA